MAAARNHEAGTWVVWVLGEASTLASQRMNVHGASRCWELWFARRPLVRARKRRVVRRTAVTRESSALGQSEVLRGMCVLAYLSRGVHLSTRSRGGLSIWLANARKSCGNGLSPSLHLYARAVYDETTVRTYGDAIVSSQVSKRYPPET
jgi:hypothetical protein